MDILERAKQRLAQAPETLCSELPDEVQRELIALMEAGAFDDCLALAKAGAYDAVAALHSHPLSPDGVEALCCVLVLGFFFPRASHWKRDVQRAQEIANNQSALFPHHDEDNPIWPEGSIALAAPIIHPLGTTLLASQLGLSSELFQAIVEEEVYLDEALQPYFLPWYREQDATLRPIAEANKLDASLPPQFLEEPYESSWYMDRSGLPFLTSVAEAKGLPFSLDAASIESIPLLPEKQRNNILMPGGCEAWNDIQYAYQIIHSHHRRLQYYTEDDGTFSSGSASFLQDCVHLLLHQLDASAPGWSPPQTPNESKDRTLTGAPTARDYHDEPSSVAAMKLEGIWFVDEESMLLTFPNALIHMSFDGQMKGLFPHWGEVKHITHTGLVLVRHGGEPHILDLNTQQWFQDCTPSELITEGKLDASLFPTTTISPYERDPHFDSHHWISGLYSPDYQYFLQVDKELIGGIFRTSDRRLVAESCDAMPPRAYGAHNQYEREPTPKITLLAPDELPSDTPANETNFHIDGIHFLLRSGTEASVKETGGLAFALHKNKWRSFAGQTIYDGHTPLITFQTPVFAGAFDRRGENLLVLSRQYAHLIALDETPHTQRHIPLTPAYDAIRAYVKRKGEHS